MTANELRALGDTALVGITNGLDAGTIPDIDILAFTLCQVGASIREGLDRLTKAVEHLDTHVSGAIERGTNDLTASLDTLDRGSR